MCFIDLAEDTSAAGRKIDRLSAARRHLAEATKPSTSSDSQTKPGAPAIRKDQPKSLMSVTSSTTTWDVVDRPSSSAHGIDKGDQQVKTVAKTSKGQPSAYHAKEASDEQAILSLLMGGEPCAAIQDAGLGDDKTIDRHAETERKMADLILQMQKHARYVDILLDRAQLERDTRADTKAMQAGTGTDWRSMGRSGSETTQSAGGSDE